MSGLQGYDAWKTASPDDEWRDDDDRPANTRDSLIIKLAEISTNVQNLGNEIGATAYAVSACEGFVIDAKMKVKALMDRRQEIAADVAILKEMLGVR